MSNTVLVGSIPQDTVEHYQKVFSYGENLQALHLTRVNTRIVLIVAEYPNGLRQVATSYNMGKLNVLYTGKDDNTVTESIITALSGK